MTEEDHRSTGGPSRPRLRDDLVVSAANGTVVIKDPAARRFYRLGEVEHFVARQLDGQTALHTVRRRVESRFGAPLADRELDEFVGTLARAGLVIPGEVQPPEGAGRVRGSALYLRIRLIDPDSVLDRLVKRLSFLFSPASLAVSGVLVAAGVAVAAADAGQLAREVSSARGAVPLLVFWLALLASVAAHELAHALTCKRLGGEVREMGFLLIFFQPALYTNVSDAWLFPERWKRLAVTFAGIYFDVCLAAAAALVWSATGPGALHSGVLALLVATAVRTVFNLNPLLKLDGYYLLSDAIEIPNLRARAFGYLRWRLARRRAEVPPREARIYAAYAVLAGAR